MDQNLLSVAQMIKNGYTVSFAEDFCIIKNASGVQTKAKMQGNSFYLNLIPSDHSAMRVTSKETDLWHKRLGHFNTKTLEYMSKNNFVENFGEIVSNSDPCQSCALGKQSRKHFPKTALKRATKALELLHSDICGPMNT